MTQKSEQYLLTILSKTSSHRFTRDFSATLKSRLLEPRRFLQVVAGFRQVGKSTLVLQVLGELGIPKLYAMFKPQRTLVVGGSGMPLAEFLEQPVEAWAKR